MNSGPLLPQIASDKGQKKKKNPKLKVEKESENRLSTLRRQGTPPLKEEVQNEKYLRKSQKSVK